jgi:hypothetical protein
MSDICRYNIKPGEEGYEIALSLGGEWVHYSDYARLQQERVHDLNQIGGIQQELARLRASSFVTAVPVEQYERVVEAGDAMALELEPSLKWNPDSDDIRYQVRLWNAAKEGKPSV